MAKETQIRTNFTTFPIEILNNIFQHLEKDIRTLYSCIQVNRNLCKQVIPYIWSNPMPNTYSSINIELFIYFFEEKEKKELRQQYQLDINDSYQPLFNYVSYLKILDPRGVRRAVFYWLKNYYVEKYPYSDIYVDFKNNQIIDFTEKALLRLILKNSSKIEKLILDLAEKYQDIPNYSIFNELQEQQGEGTNHGIREITKLSIISSSVIQFDNIQGFLYILPIICRKIQKIKLHDLFLVDQNMELKLYNIIREQKNLTSINLAYNFVNILRSISSLKYHAASLKKLVLKYIYHNDRDLLNTFDQLINLEYLEIKECFPIKIILEPLIRANLKLVTLKINDNESRYDLIESIIKSSGSTLKQLELNIFIDMIENRSTLSKLCPNLTYLHLKINNRVICDDNDKGEKHSIFFNYINNLVYLKYFYMEFYLIYMIGDFDQLINLSSLQFVSLKDHHYSLDSLKKWFDYFTTIFNNITFYIDNGLEDFHKNVLEDFAQEKKDDGFNLVYTLDGFYKFVAKNQILY
ncbi:hypothetical protein C1645_869798 [Glomus cerebriforme]|uniref:F-box domain-containing protein n=1 Tax=Glomus cerebriforme TaxID=658196 RepID=A0A397TNJ0_9GLOM|nr:hypothetical protein C1645_869798 [Glomus cerebriforme]